MVSLADTIAKHGLDAYREAILATERPCVYLTLGAPSDPDSAGSRIGGRPLLPAAMPWPTGDTGRPLTFVLQIDLAELSPLTDNPLPKQGLLSFFIDSGWPSAWDVPFVCLHVDGEISPREAPKTDNNPHVDFAPVPPHQLALHAGSEIPGWTSSDYESLAATMSESEQESLSQDLVWSLEPSDAKGPLIGKLFGYVIGIGDDPRPNAERDRGVAAERWRNLLIVKSCRALDLCIWDAGYVEVMVPAADLAASRLTELYATIESS